MQRQFPSKFFIEDKHKVYTLLSIKITGQKKHTQLRSIACISRHTSFKRMEENMNLSRTIVFRTKLFFWQVCVCSAKGDTPLDPRFSFLSSFSLIKSSCHFSFFSLVSEHNACRFWLVEFEFKKEGEKKVLLFLQGEKHFQCIGSYRCAKANWSTACNLPPH